MVDLDKEVVVREGGDEIYRGVPQRTLSALLMCAGAKYDPKMMFPVVIPLKK